MNTVEGRYTQFALHRRRLGELADGLEKLLSRLDQPTRREAVSSIKSRIQSDDFKVMVLGAFKTGKSTLINALLGEEVLPAYATPCTAVINEVKWGDDRRAVIHFATPLPDPLPKGTPDGVVEHLGLHQGGTPPPLEVTAEQLEEYVVIRDPAAKHADSPLFSKVELFWPLELCKNGVQIIDSPGLNEHASREKVTMDYLTIVDAVMFTLNCGQLASMSEMDFHETYVRGAGHESTFFVCNRIDTVRPRSEQKRVREHGMKRLVPLTTLKERGVHFISAADALDARVEEEPAPELLEASNVPELESQLAHFLVNERGRVKLIRPAQELRRVCEELVSTVIPAQVDMLGGELEELQKQHEALQPRLNEARATRDRIVRQIELSQRQMEKDVSDAADRALREIISSIPDWAETSEVETKIKIFTLKHKEAVESLVKEVSRVIERKIHNYVNRWKSATLGPLLERHANEMNREIEADIEAFYVGLDAMQAKMMSGPSKPVEEARISGKERFLASMAGLFIGDLYSGLHGARFGYSGLATAIGTQLGLVITMLILGVANPFIIIPVLIGGGLFNAFINADRLTGKIKRKVGEGFAENLQSKAGGFASAISSEVMKKAEKFRARADKALSDEILQIEEQMDSVLEAKKKGEAAVNEARDGLRSAQVEAQEVSSKLFDFAADLATGTEGAAA